MVRTTLIIVGLVALCALPACDVMLDDNRRVRNYDTNEYTDKEYTAVVTSKVTTDVDDLVTYVIKFEQHGSTGIKDDVVIVMPNHMADVGDILRIREPGVLEFVDPMYVPPDKDKPNE